MLDRSRLLEAWEVGSALHPLERALVLLQQFRPESDWRSLSRLPIGKRDGLLLDLREQLFGPNVDAYAQCGSCNAEIELELDCRALRVEGPADSECETPRQLVVDGYSIRYRLPNSGDLAAACTQPDHVEARRELLTRCVVQVDVSGDSGTCPRGDELPESVTSALVARLAEDDPQADIVISLICPECGTQDTRVFDIASWLWREVGSLRRGLLDEVWRLACETGWSESEILAMSSTRRRHYLGRLEARLR